MTQLSTNLIVLFGSRGLQANETMFSRTRQMEVFQADIDVHVRQIRMSMENKSVQNVT